MAEAAYALRAGALWVAANTDATLPNERGLAPGNGSMVAGGATRLSSVGRTRRNDEGRNDEQAVVRAQSGYSG